MFSLPIVNLGIRAEKANFLQKKTIFSISAIFGKCRRHQDLGPCCKMFLALKKIPNRIWGVSEVSSRNSKSFRSYEKSIC